MNKVPIHQPQNVRQFKMRANWQIQPINEQEVEVSKVIPQSAKGAHDIKQFTFNLDTLKSGNMKDSTTPMGFMSSRADPRPIRS